MEKRRYNQSIITFDIETTSLFSYSSMGKWGAFRYESAADLVEIGATMYVAMFCVEGHFVYFRTWADVRKQLEEIRDAASDEWTIIWVHNLPFEFGYLKNIISDFEVFARQPRKPISARSPSLRVEFRCSYALTQQSLAAAAKSFSVPTQKGELNYRLIRGKTTPLTEEELDYCKRDVVALYEIIKVYRERYRRIERIPLTSTSTIRKQVKKECKRLYKRTGHMQPRDAETFKLVMDTFAGGYVHANAAHTADVLKRVKQKDLASAYPAAMLLELFPDGPLSPAPPEMFEEIRESGRCFFGRFVFTNICARGYNTYLSASKCHNVESFPHFNCDNGRIHSAPFIDISICDLDYKTICENYTFDDCICVELYDCRRGRLDPDFLKFVLKLYKDKTELKNIEGREDDYRIAKTYINGLFGMGVTNTVRDEVCYEQGRTENGQLCEWYDIPLTIPQVEEKLQKIADYQKAPLAFQVGVYIPAIVRRWLWSIIHELEYDNIYNDTDSIKYIGEHQDLFDKFNEAQLIKHKLAAEYLGVDVSEFAPLDKHGAAHPIGIFEGEPDAVQFCTLGAKRYAETIETENGHKTIITVAGVRKQNLHNIHHFFNNRIFNERESGKLVCGYIDNQEPIFFYDYLGNPQVATEMSSINLRPTNYVLSVEPSYEFYYTTTKASVLFGRDNNEMEEIWNETL